MAAEEEEEEEEEEDDDDEISCARNNDALPASGEVLWRAAEAEATDVTWPRSPRSPLW